MLLCCQLLCIIIDIYYCDVSSCLLRGATTYIVSVGSQIASHVLETSCACSMLQFCPAAGDEGRGKHRYDCVHIIIDNLRW